MNSLLEKINSCESRLELDKLRLEIVNDMEHFEENQKAFIKKQNSLRRQGKTRYKEGYALDDVIRNKI